jgi:hypothetical protein
VEEWMGWKNGWDGRVEEWKGWIDGRIVKFVLIIFLWKTN